MKYKIPDGGWSLIMKGTVPRYSLRPDEVEYEVIFPPCGENYYGCQTCHRRREHNTQHTRHVWLEKLTAKSAGWRWRSLGQQVYVLLMPVRRTESQAEPVHIYHRIIIPQSSRRCRPPQSNRRSFQLPVCSLPNTWQPPVRHKNPPQTPFFHQTSSLPTLLRGSRHDTNSRKKIERLRCLFSSLVQKQTTLNSHQRCWTWLGASALSQTKPSGPRPTEQRCRRVQWWPALLLLIPS